MIIVRVIAGTLLPPLLGSLPFGVGDAIRYDNTMIVVRAATVGYLLMGVQSCLYSMAMEWLAGRLKKSRLFTLWRFLGVSTIGGALAGASLGVLSVNRTVEALIVLGFWVVYGAAVGIVCGFLLWTLHGKPSKPLRMDYLCASRAHNR